MNLITFALLFSFFHVYSLDPAILWQKTIGGSAGDYSNAFEATSDGGYILGGFSNSSISGEKTENGQGGYDIWIVKIDASGNIMWQNTLVEVETTRYFPLKDRKS